MADGKVVFNPEELTKEQLINLVAQKEEKLIKTTSSLDYVQRLYDRVLRENAIADYVKKEANK